MGQFGSGIFGNDSAADFRDEFVRQIKQHLYQELCFLKYDEQIHSEPSDIPFLLGLSLLHLSCLELDKILFEPEPLKQWQEVVQKLWKFVEDKHTEVSDTFKKRKALAQDTFEKLITYAEVVEALIERPASKSHLGTWHHELINNDIAHKYIEKKIIDLSHYFQSALYTVEHDDDWFMWLYDDYSSESLLAAVEIMRVLCKNTGVNPLKEARVKLWKQQYINFWKSEDVQYVDYETIEHEVSVIEELQLIEKTFDELIELSIR